MGRGIGFRTLLVGLTLCFGLLVLFLALSGVVDAVRGSGVVLEWTERTVLERALLSTQLARGLIGLVLALLLAAAVGGALSRMFAALRPPSAGDAARVGDAARSALPTAANGYADDLRGPAPADAPAAPWLREGQDLADSLGWLDEAHGRQVDALARERAELDRLIDAVSEGILQIDGAGRVVRANRAARRLLALPRDVEGMQVSSAVRSAELRALLVRPIEDGGPPREIVFEERTLIVTARPLVSPAMPAPSAESDGLAVAIADLTALRRMETVRRDFVANASHELKTPLTSIRGYAETLLDEGLPPDTRRQFAETIFSNADRLQHIVDDLLDLSRLESGRWQPVIERVDATGVARDAWSDLAARAAENGVAFDIDAAAGDAVLADRSALRQIFDNLLENALRYTGSGGRIAVRIVESSNAGARAAIGPQPVGARLLAIEVSDTGAGIPGDALPRIFERFYRVDPARSRAEGGTGLGLSIVRHLAESMAGSVEAESLLGRGTTIRVVLPAADDGGAERTPAA